MVGDPFPLPSIVGESEVPQGWEVVPLGQVADVRFSSVDKLTRASEEPIRLCNYIDVYDNDYITGDLQFMRASATQPEIDRFRLQVDDVIVTKDSETPNDIGIPAVVDYAAPDLICGYHLGLIRPKLDHVDPTFLAKQLAQPRWARYFGQQANGLTRYGLPLAAVQKTPLWLPDIHEQKTIGAVLRLVDEAITTMEAVIVKLKQVRAGLLHDLLTCGLDQNSQLRDPIEHPDQFQDTALGRIPRDWSVRTLEECCSDVVDCPHSTPDFRETGVLVARTMHIKDGLFDDGAASRVSETDYLERIARLKPQGGDVILTREAPVGEAFVVPEGMRICLGQRVMLLRPRPDRLLGSYLVAQIYSGTVRRRIDALTGGTTKPT